MIVFRKITPVYWQNLSQVWKLKSVSAILWNRGRFHSMDQFAFYSFVITTHNIFLLSKGHLMREENSIWLQKFSKIFPLNVCIISLIVYFIIFIISSNFLFYSQDLSLQWYLYLLFSNFFWIIFALYHLNSTPWWISFKYW